MMIKLLHLIKMLPNNLSSFYLTCIGSQIIVVGCIKNYDYADLRKIC